MNKVDLVNRVAGKSDLTKAAVERALDGLVQVVHEALARGDAVNLPGVGKLTPVMRQAREGRNPASGEKVSIPARRAAKFSAAAQLKQALG